MKQKAGRVAFTGLLAALAMPFPFWRGSSPLCP